MLYNNICNVEVTIKQQQKNKEVTTMKNLKRIVPLVMAGAMLVSPVSISAQAKETDNTIGIQTLAKVYGNAKIKGNGVRVRQSPSESGTIVGQLYNGDRVQANGSVVVSASGRKWRYCVSASGLVGFVADEYIQMD